MAILPEIDKEIEDEAKALKTEEFLRPQSGISEFLDSFTGIIGQSIKDREALVASGFAETKYVKYPALQEKLSLVHGVRLSSTGLSSEDATTYNTGLEQAKKNKKILASAAKFALNNSNGAHDIKRAYNSMKTGQAEIDILIYNIAAVNFARKFNNIIKNVKPAGQELNETYLSDVENNAVALLKLKGITDTSDGVDFSVDQQNRILTLCIRAYRDIKQYADQAFLFDPDYYSKYYSDYKAVKTEPDDNVTETDITKAEGPASEKETTKKEVIEKETVPA